LPYGRGGSPIQNLILEGFSEAPVNALSMTSELDAGDIYLSKKVSLGGNLNEILDRISTIIQEMIIQIVNGDYNLSQQSGNPKYFKRRSGIQNELPIFEDDIKKIYNQIRMLDAPDYPCAYLNMGNFSFEFSDSQLQDDEIQAKVKIKRVNN
jgi:methionyl-tRNA formyltransferase